MLALLLGAILLAESAGASAAATQNAIEEQVNACAQRKPECPSTLTPVPTATPSPTSTSTPVPPTDTPAPTPTPEPCWLTDDTGIAFAEDATPVPCPEDQPVAEEMPTAEPTPTPQPAPTRPA